MMRTILSTILRVYLWVGMVSLFPIGFINYTDLVKNLSVKFAEVQATGGVEPSRNTFKSGAMPME